MAAGHVAAAVDGVEGGQDARVNARRSRICRLADTALVCWEPADVRRALGHDGHQLCTGADIFRSHIGTVQALNGIAQVEHGVALALLSEHGVARYEDHRFSATPVQPSGRVL